MLTRKQFSKAQELVSASMPNMRVLSPEETAQVLSARAAAAPADIPAEAGTSLEKLQARYGGAVGRPVQAPAGEEFTVLVVPKVARGAHALTPRTVIIAGGQIAGMQG